MRTYYSKLTVVVSLVFGVLVGGSIAIPSHTAWDQQGHDAVKPFFPPEDEEKEPDEKKDKCSEFEQLVRRLRLEQALLEVELQRWERDLKYREQRLRRRMAELDKLQAETAAGFDELIAEASDELTSQVLSEFADSVGEGVAVFVLGFANPWATLRLPYTIFEMAHTAGSVYAMHELISRLNYIKFRREALEAMNLKDALDFARKHQLQKLARLIRAIERQKDIEERWLPELQRMLETHVAKWLEDFQKIGELAEQLDRVREDLRFAAFLLDSCRGSESPELTLPAFP